jgi:hypothetical protein
MKTFRTLNESFIPGSVLSNVKQIALVVILPKTDYKIVDTNQAFGIYIKVTSPMIMNPKKVISQNVYISPEEISKYGEVQNKLNISDLKNILDNISFAPSCVDFHWSWEIIEVVGQHWEGTEPISKGPIKGFLINTSFQRPDTNTGIVGIGKGRRMWIEETASETSVVMTAWICVDLIVKHELMESLLYQNAKILNPHKTLEQLAYPETLKKSK